MHDNALRGFTKGRGSKNRTGGRGGGGGRLAKLMMLKMMVEIFLDIWKYHLVLANKDILLDIIKSLSAVFMPFSHHGCYGTL